MDGRGVFSTQVFVRLGFEMDMVIGNGMDGMVWGIDYLTGMV